MAKWFPSAIKTSQDVHGEVVSIGHKNVTGRPIRSSLTVRPCFQKMNVSGWDNLIAGFCLSFVGIGYIIVTTQLYTSSVFGGTEKGLC